jgi:hypothetical protein
MNTLVKRSAKQLVEEDRIASCQAIDQTWDADHGIPDWAIWSATIPHGASIPHLKHLASSIFIAPTVKVLEVDHVQFTALADEWEVETEFISRQSRAVMHPAYQRIIGMGPPVVPLLLERLRDQPDNWFWALTAITGEDPGAGSTTLLDARGAWLVWGHDRGLID